MRIAMIGDVALSTTETSAWAFGWEALVAIGTIGLALATAFLAWTTRKVALKTHDVATATQSEILADWRPVLLLRETIGGQPGIRAKADRLEIQVENCGRGPALDVSAGMMLMEGGAAVAEPQRIAIAPGESVRFEWTPLVEIFGKRMGRLSYADLSYTGYETSFSIASDAARNLRLDWQRVDSDPTYQAPLYGP